jgi:tRNA(fMet)-specific endonuclease VapC
MPFLIDTDICSAHLRGRSAVSSRFLQHSGQLYISVLTLGELLSWTRRAKSPPSHGRSLQGFLNDVAVLDIDQPIAEKFGEVRAQLLDAGRSIASIDLMIGSTALVHGLTMVTHNVQHFAPIPGLAVEDWLAP